MSKLKEIEQALRVIARELWEGRETRLLLAAKVEEQADAMHKLRETLKGRVLDE